jgi:hypothetical protein
VRFYHGFATAIFVPTAEATIAERYPAKRGERISVFSSATAIGRAIAPFLGGYILFLTNYGYSTLYLAVGATGVAAFMVALFFLIEGKSPEKQSEETKSTTNKVFQGWLRVAKKREVQIVGFVQASQYYVYGTVEFFLVGYLAENEIRNRGLVKGTGAISDYEQRILSKIAGSISDPAESFSLGGGLPDGHLLCSDRCCASHCAGRQRLRDQPNPPCRHFHRQSSDRGFNPSCWNEPFYLKPSF